MASDQEPKSYEKFMSGNQFDMQGKFVFSINSRLPIKAFIF